MQVDRAGVDLAGRARCIDGAQEPAIGSIDDHDLLARPAAQRYRRVGGFRGKLFRAGGGNGHGKPPAFAAAHEALLRKLVDDLAGTPLSNGGIIQRFFHRRAVDMAKEDIGVRGVKDACFHRFSQ